MEVKQHGRGIVPDHPLASYGAYLQRVGGGAVAKARRMAPSAIIEEIKRAGLRGRGGAGYPTGVKWATIAGHRCATRFVVCNAAEGEPGTFKDRYLLERNPYATIEGMLIAAHAVDAEAGFIAIKASFARPIAALRRALGEMKDLCGGFSITLVEGPDEYLFGEETAMLNVIEGEGPLPRPPEYPAYEVGLRATPGSPNPALCNNAETLAHVPGIIRDGAMAFRTLGTADTPGTLIVTLSGDLQRQGVFEVPAGTTLRQLFHGVGGGPRPGRTLKAALPGVSSGVIMAEEFDTPADFASLRRLGSNLGSAGFIVFDDTASMPRVAQAVTRFLYVESCNQCSACKEGLLTASRALDEIFDPDRAGSDDLEQAFFGASRAPQGNRCYLPVQGATLVPSLLHHFRGEFDAQVASPAEAAAPYVVPKFLDFDERSRAFVIDPRQARKLPNWTYADAAEASPGGSTEQLGDDGAAGHGLDGTP